MSESESNHAKELRRVIAKKKTPAILAAYQRHLEENKPVYVYSKGQACPYVGGFPA